MTTNRSTKITFKLESETEVLVIRDDKVIGRIWSENTNNDKYVTPPSLPYPHDNSEYCKNSIQICGFDKMSEVWACGIFKGTKDCVVHFRPVDNEYYQKMADKYADYVKKFFKGEHHELKTGVETIVVDEVKKRPNVDLTKLLSFNDFCSVHPFVE